MSDQKHQGLKRLLNPKHICVIGGCEAEVVVEQLLAFNSTLTIYPINPSRDTIAGITCLRQVSDLPIAPDATFIAIPPQKSVAVIAQLNALGAGGIICYSSGFAELNKAGKALQDELLNVAKDVAIIGPNCYGMINYLDSIALWPDNFGGQHCESGCALISQSGNLAINLSFQRHGLPISHLITVGNQADCDIATVIEVLLDDTRVKSIGIYLESITDIASFCEVANRARQRQVPIVVIKSGTSATGAKMAHSHTSAMISEDYLYDCLFQQLGIARAHQLDEFLETLKLVTCYGVSSGDQFVSISCSGGEAALIADYIETATLVARPFSQSATQQLQSTLGERVHISNPLDYQTYIWGNYQALYNCFKSVADDNFQWLVVVLDYPTAERADLSSWQTCEQAFIDAMAATNNCGIIVSTLAENMPSAVMQRLLQNNIVPMQGLVSLVKAIDHAITIGRFWREDGNFVPLRPQAVPNCQTIDEYQSKQLLASSGLQCPAGRLVSADNMAHDIAYPVVVKAVGSDLLHKTELDALQLNIANSAALQKAINSMAHLSHQFLVEAMQPKPIAELLLAIKRDSHFGWVLTIGMGGVEIEIVSDYVSLLLPVNHSQIVQGIQKLQRFELLNGYRNQAAVDLAMLTDSITTLCDLATRRQNAIAEIEINPLMVYASHCVIVDALILKA